MLMYTPSHHIIFLKGYLSADITVQCMVFLLIAFPSKKMLVLVKVNHLKIEKRGICVFASVMCSVMLTDCHYQGLSIRPFFFWQSGRQSKSVSQSVTFIFYPVCFVSSYISYLSAFVHIISITILRK